MERKLGALAAAVVLLSAVAGLIYQSRSAREGPLTSSGFDLSAVAPPPAAASGAAQQASRSGLGMVLSLPGMSFGAAAAGAAPTQPAARTPQAPPSDVQAAVRETEGPVSALAMEYTRNYPVIRAYGRDWMSHPDLKKLNDDYMRRHDPVAFLIGLAQAPSFPPLVKKYAAAAPFRYFVLDGVKRAPPDALQTAFDYVGADARMKTLVDGVSRSLGFPPDAFAQAAGGQAVKLDDAQLAKIVGDAQRGQR